MNKLEHTYKAFTLPVFSSQWCDHMSLDEKTDERLKMFGDEYALYEAECGRNHEEPISFSDYCKEAEGDLWE